MALKYRIKKLDDVPEAVRSLYKADGDDFVLDAEGIVPKERLDEFRENNIVLKQQMDKLKDIDPVKYRELQQLETAVTEGKLIKAGKLEEVVNLRVDAMKKEKDTKIAELEAITSQQGGQLSALLIDNGVKSAAIKKGVLPTAVDDVVARARGVYVVENGAPIAKKGADVIFGKDGKTPMQPDEWIDGLKESAPHLFQGTQGSGAGGGRMIGGRDTSKMSSADKIQAGLVASGLIPNSGQILGDLPGRS